MRRITKVGRRNVKIRREDWETMWDRIKLSLAVAQTRRGGGGCDGFCGAACADNSGCDLSFGDEGECGALCQDGEVFIQEQV